MDTNAFVLTVKETCDALRIGRTTAYALVGAGKLKAVKIGQSTRITMESIRALATGENLSAANDEEAAELATGVTK